MKESDHGNGQRHHHVAEDMVAGFCGGFCGVALGFPLDVIKTRIQTSHHTNQGAGKSVFRTGRRIVRSEGIGGLYKGLASPLMTLSLSSSISFSSYGAFRELYAAEDRWDWKNGFAGASCGPITGVISTVENHVRVSTQSSS